jgi:hypothetical protein
MLGFLRAILTTLRDLVMGQASLSDQMNRFEGDVDTTFVALRADLEAQFTATDAAIAHITALIEGDDLPVNVGAPTFTPTGGTQ